MKRADHKLIESLRWDLVGGFFSYGHFGSDQLSK